MKTCTKCKQTKDYTEFSKQKHAKDGYSGWCKQCHVEYSCASEAQRKSKAKWYAENREQCIERSKQYNFDHKEEIAEKHRIWYEKNKEHKIAYNKRRYQEKKAQQALDNC